MKKLSILLSIIVLLTISCKQSKLTIYKVKHFGIRPNTGLFVGDTLQKLFNSLASRDSLNKGYSIQFEEGVYIISDSTFSILSFQNAVELKRGKTGHKTLKKQ